RGRPGGTCRSVYSCKQGFHGATARNDEARSQLSERVEDEPALVHTRVRDGEARLVDRLVAVHKRVESARPRAELAGDANTAEALLDGEQPVEELARAERGLERGHAVEEARLLADADPACLAQPGGGPALESFLGAERVAGCAECSLAVTDVGAEPDVGARHGLVTVAATVPSRPAG